MDRLTIGKIRGLQQLSSPGGIFCILAADQRGNLRRMMERAGRGPATYERVVGMKMDLVSHLAQDATGVLLDPNYGAAQAVAAGVLPGPVGLVVALEDTGYEERAGDRLTHILEDWSVAQIKAMGAQAVKVLLYYNGRREAAARHQQQVVAEVAEQCRAHDIPFMLEPVTYPAEDQDEGDFRRDKAEVVIGAARDLGRYQVDLLKMEFPVDPKMNQDADHWQEACQRLTEACRVPWALLSAGVDFDTYLRQLQIACAAGASGFVAGRAIWQEAVTTQDESERREFTAREMPRRLRRLVEVAEGAATPWHQIDSHRYGPGHVGEEWYAAYPGLAAD